MRIVSTILKAKDCQSTEIFFQRGPVLLNILIRSLVLGGIVFGLNGVHANAQTRAETEAWLLTTLNRLAGPEKIQNDFINSRRSRSSNSSNLVRFAIDTCDLYRVEIHANRHDNSWFETDKLEAELDYNLYVDTIPLSAVQTIETREGNCGDEACEVADIKTMYEAVSEYYVFQSGKTTEQPKRPAYDVFRDAFNNFDVCKGFPQKGQPLSQICDEFAVVGREDEILTQIYNSTSAPKGWPDQWKYQVSSGRGPKKSGTRLALIMGQTNDGLPNDLGPRLTKAFAHLKTFSDAAGCETGASPF